MSSFAPASKGSDGAGDYAEFNKPDAVFFKGNIFIVLTFLYILLLLKVYSL